MRATIFGGIAFFTGGIMHAMAWIAYAMGIDFPEQLSIVGFAAMGLGLGIGLIGMLSKKKKCEK